MRRLQSWLVLFFALAMLLVGSSGRASQNTCILPTVGTVSGLTLVQDINLCSAAMLSLQSGATAPSSPTTGMLWMDTSTSPRAIKQYDGTSWSVVWWLDNTNHLIAPPVGGGTDSINSATTTDLWSLPQASLTVNGTTTITALASASATPGTIKVIKFAGILTLTYNATSLIIPGAANVTTAAGDYAVILALTNTNVSVISYTRAANAAGGAVTSVATSGGITGGTITSTGTLNLGQSRPGGRLTLTTGVPVLQSSVTAATTLYYTPYITDLVPIYDGAAVWTTKIFAELSVALSSSANWGSGSLYDWFVVNDSGTLRLCSGPAWASSTSRGTGAGTTQLSVQNGLYLNTVSMTCRYASASTLTAGALTATYVGTTYMTANGQTSVTFGTIAANGGAGTFGVYNAYNRTRIASLSGDNTNTWTYNSTTWRAANNSSTIRHTFVAGLNEDFFKAHYNFIIDCNTAPAPGYGGVGFDVTNAFSGTTAAAFNSGGSTITFSGMASLEALPGLGLHFVSAIDSSQATGVFSYYGDANGSVAQTGIHFEWLN